MPVRPARARRRWRVVVLGLAAAAVMAGGLLLPVCDPGTGWPVVERCVHLWPPTRPTPAARLAAAAWASSVLPVRGGG